MLWYSFELHRHVDAIQMDTDNICFYKAVNKEHTGCNLKTTELLDWALIGVCAVIRSITVCPESGTITEHCLPMASRGKVNKPQHWKSSAFTSFKLATS